MKRLLSAAAALFCAVALLPFAPAQTTTVTATQLKIGGTPITSGNVSVLAVDSRGAALSIFASDGSLNGPAAFKGSVTSGAISNGFSVPDQCTSTASTMNTPIFYRVEASSTTAPNQTIVVVIPPGTVCGSTFALDHYSPMQTATPAAAGLLSGSTVPTSCTTPGMFYLSTAPYTQYQCENGHFAASPSSGGASIGLTTNGSSGPATLISGVLNIPQYTGSGSASIAVTAVNCYGATALTLPSADAMFRITPSAACTLNFTAPSGSGGYRYSFQVVGTAYAVTFPASSGSLTWTGGTPPTSPSSGQYTDFAMKWFGSAPLSGTY